MNGKIIGYFQNTVSVTYDQRFQGDDIIKKFRATKCYTVSKEYFAAASFQKDNLQK